MPPPWFGDHHPHLRAVFGREPRWQSLTEASRGESIQAPLRQVRHLRDRNLQHIERDPRFPVEHPGAEGFVLAVFFKDDEVVGGGIGFTATSA